jgi:hypothetical protein
MTTDLLEIRDRLRTLAAQTRAAARTFESALRRAEYVRACNPDLSGLYFPGKAAARCREAAARAERFLDRLGQLFGEPPGAALAEAMNK